MGRLSRGCLRCRQRRVRCDEARPSCRRCLARDELCEGYRDEASLLFRHETARVVERNLALQDASRTLLSPPSSSRRSSSVDTSQTSRRSSWTPATRFDGTEPASLTGDEMSGINVPNHLPWLKEPSEMTSRAKNSLEDRVVDQFMDKYVMYPCNQTSSPGFLEHLPSMFKEVSVEGRYALRWAVQAAAYADAAKRADNAALANKALQCYGRALEALGESLAMPGKAPDDYDLMTVAVLDIFETLHTPDQVKKGSHAQGMAQLLRLRGSDLIYSPRGWSLFRLGHHRIQKQRLAFNTPRIGETSDLLDRIHDNEPYARLERSAHDISETCQRARDLLDIINMQTLPATDLVSMIQELRALDQAAVSWRQTSQWSFTTLTVSERPDLEPAARGITDRIQLHPDVWQAYEWNYHRTARIIFLQQLLKCSLAALEAPDLAYDESCVLQGEVDECLSTIRWLADEYLATVPQSFGDVDHLGRPHSDPNHPPACRAVGGYLLLWSTKTVRSEASSVTHEQRQRASRVFERIREYTGMRELLGDKSII